MVVVVDLKQTVYMYLKDLSVRSYTFTRSQSIVTDDRRMEVSNIAFIVLSLQTVAVPVFCICEEFNMHGPRLWLCHAMSTNSSDLLYLDSGQTQESACFCTFIHHNQKPLVVSVTVGGYQGQVPRVMVGTFEFSQFSTVQFSMPNIVPFVYSSSNELCIWIDARGNNNAVFRVECRSNSNNQPPLRATEAPLPPKVQLTTTATTTTTTTTTVTSGTTDIPRKAPTGGTIVEDNDDNVTASDEGDTNQINYELVAGLAIGLIGAAVVIGAVLAWIHIRKHRGLHSQADSSVPVQEDAATMSDTPLNKLTHANVSASKRSTGEQRQQSSNVTVAYANATDDGICEVGDAGASYNYIDVTCTDADTDKGYSYGDIITREPAKSAEDEEGYVDVDGQGGHGHSQPYPPSDSAYVYGDFQTN